MAFFEIYSSLCFYDNCDMVNKIRLDISAYPADFYTNHNLAVLPQFFQNTINIRVNSNDDIKMQEQEEPDD